MICINHRGTWGAPAIETLERLIIWQIIQSGIGDLDHQVYVDPRRQRWMNAGLTLEALARHSSSTVWTSCPLFGWDPSASRRACTSLFWICSYLDLRTPPPGSRQLAAGHYDQDHSHIRPAYSEHFGDGVRFTNSLKFKNLYPGKNVFFLWFYLWHVNK